MVNRYVYATFGLGASVLTSGILFGFAALHPVLIEQGVYESLCTTEQAPCVAQELRLNLVFTLGSVAATTTALAIGVILDKKGPRFVCRMGCIALICSLSILGLSSPSFDGYIVGFICLGASCPTIYLSIFHLGNLFPSRSGLYMAFVNGSFDASAFVFFAWRGIIAFTGISLSTMFFLYCIVPIGIFIASFFMWPKRAFTHGDTADGVSYAPMDEQTDVHSTPEDDGEGGTGDHAGDIELNTSVVVSPDISPESSVMKLGEQQKARQLPQGALLSLSHLYDSPLSSGMRSPAACLNGVVFAVTVTRLNFVMSTIPSQLKFIAEHRGTSDRAATFEALFNVFLPAGGLAFIPIALFALDTVPLSTSFFIMIGGEVVFGILNVAEYLEVQALAFVVFALARPFAYTCLAVSIGKIFGQKNFGVYYGCLTFCAAVVSLSIYLWTYLALDVARGRFLYVNIVLTGLTCLLLALPFYLRLHERRSAALTLQTDLRQAPGLVQ